MQFCTLSVRIDYKTIEISKILCYNICACQAAHLGKGGLYHPAMKPPDIDKRTDKPTEAAPAAPLRRSRPTLQTARKSCIC